GPPQLNTRAAAKKPDNQDDPVLEKRLELIKARLGESSDIIIREICSSQDKVKLTVLFIDGLVDKKAVSDNIIQPLLSSTIVNDYAEKLNQENAFALIQKHIVSFAEVSTAPNLTQSIKMVLTR